jgi:O-antigen ligase
MRAEAEAGAGAAMLAVVVGLAAACAFAASRIDSARPVAYLRPLAAAALVAALAVTILSVRSGTPTTGSERLVSAQSNRYDYWRVAVATFADHPLNGIGTGSFRVEWLLRRDRDESVRDAHSLYLETAAELGIIGLAALAVFLFGIVSMARSSPGAGGAIGALAVYAVHAGLDWDWEMPALTLVALTLAARLATADAPPDAS